MSATCSSTLKIVAFSAIPSLPRNVAKHADRDVAHRHCLPLADLAGLAHFDGAVDLDRARRDERLAGPAAHTDARDLEEVVESDEFAVEAKHNWRHSGCAS